MSATLPLILALHLLPAGLAQASAEAQQPPIPARPCQQTAQGSGISGGLTPEQRARNVELVGHIGGAAYAVAVRDEYAYVGVGSWLVALDISDPTRLVVAGKAEPLWERVKDIAVVGEYAYVANGASGLRIFDLSNPASPVEVGHYDTAGDATRVAVAGGYAYVADGNCGLRIIAVSDPASPRETGFVFGPDRPVLVRGVAVAGSYAYLADRYQGLRVVDVSNPMSPMEVSSYRTPGDAYAVAVAGDYAYLVAWGGGLRVIDVSDPADPREAGYSDTPWNASAVVVAGDYAYVADWASGLRVVDVSNPASPTEVGFFRLPGYAHNLSVGSGYAFVADDFYGLYAIDVFDPTKPAGFVLYDTPRSPVGVDIAGSYAYVADSDGLRIVDVSNPSAPTVVGAYRMEKRSARAVTVAGDHAYVPDTALHLHIINISDPARPRGLGSYRPPGPGPLGAVWVIGNYAYVPASSDASSDGLFIVDVSDPAAPREVGSARMPRYALGVVVKGHYAYVANGGWGLRIIDVSNQEEPNEVGAYDTPWDASGVAVEGNYAYVADVWGSLRIIDVSHPTSPREASFYKTVGPASKVAVAGGYAYVANSDRGLRVIDVSDAAQPEEVGFYDTPGSASGVAVAGDYAYVADSSGLWILRFVEPGPSQPAPSGAQPQEPPKPATAISAEEALQVVLSHTEEHPFIFHPFPKRIGKVACEIRGGGPYPGIRVEGSCETRVEAEDSHWIVSFIQTWDAQRFHHATELATGQLSHTWWFKVEDSGRIIEEGHFGHFPPQWVA